MKIRENQFAIDRLRELGWQFSWGFVREAGGQTVYPASNELIAAIAEDDRYASAPGYERTIGAIFEGQA